MGHRASVNECRCNRWPLSTGSAAAVNDTWVGAPIAADVVMRIWGLPAAARRVSSLFGSTVGDADCRMRASVHDVPPGCPEGAQMTLCMPHC